MTSSLQILRSDFSPFSLNSKFSRKPSWIFSTRIVKFQSFRSSKYGVGQRFRVCCGVQGGENQSKGEEPPESLFMKELKRRGMNPTSLLEDSKKTIYEVEEGVKFKEEDGGFSMRNAVSTDYDKSLSGQRERSMMLNSEGLEGLIPRAKVLLTIGGTFFLGFWPLILITIALFSALYLGYHIILSGIFKASEPKSVLDTVFLVPKLGLILYFGPTFVHDGSDTPISLPQYIDPYQLLEDERISQIAPSVN